MASGAKKLVINTQERAVSTDVNRLQDFSAKTLAEVLRYMLNLHGQSGATYVSDDLDAGGVAVENSTLTAPMVGEILNGLMVRPQNGTLNLLVDPGVLLAIDPDSDPDASNYKIVEDPGVQTAGLLQMTANASGSTRVDVIEVQVTSVITETANRDIFNTSTGLFSTTSVTKATQATCTLGFPGASASNVRVRAGTPGSGIPAAAAGWLPLCVAVVPASATLCDTMVFYDVRPLVGDRQYGVTTNGSTRVQNRSGVFGFDGTNTTGWVEAAINGRRAGGRMREGEGTSDADSVNVSGGTSSPPYDQVTSAPVKNRPLYFYLCFPRVGMPRWARYTNAAPRLPRSPRGIFALSQVAPDEAGFANIPLNVAVFGAATNTDAICVGAGYWDSSAGPGAIALFFGSKEHGYYLEASSTAAFPAGAVNGLVVGNPTLSGSPGNPIAYEWTLVSGTHFPPCAREVLVELQANMSSLTNPAPVIWTLQVASSVNGIVNRSHLFEEPSNGDGFDDQTFRVWVPVQSPYPVGATNNVNVSLIAEVFVGGITYTGSAANSHARVLGWRL